MMLMSPCGKAKIFLTLLSLSVSLSAAPAFACPTGNPDSLAYIQRGDRCEGIIRHNISASIRLISFTTSTLTGTPREYPNRLTLRIPGINQQPQFMMQSLARGYRLDNLNRFLPIRNGMEYYLDTQPILQKAQVAPDSLRAIAYLTQKSENIYYPVILNSGSERYEFSIFVGNARTTFPTVEIRKDGRVYYSTPQRFPKTGEVRFNWTFGNAPAGRYELYMVMEQQKPGQQKERDESRIPFYHNPAWF